MNELWIPDGPDVRRVQLEDAGSFTGGGHKLLLHTTEGGTLDSVISTLRQKRAATHFIADLKSGKTVQCIALNRAARGLAHPSGPETNRANVIQIEILGFARDTPKWSNKEYENLASLCRAIHRRFSYPLRVRSFHPNPKRFTGDGFVRFGGICGHSHVPGNDHWDPGALKGQVLLEKIKKGL